MRYRRLSELRRCSAGSGRCSRMSPVIERSTSSLGEVVPRRLSFPTPSTPDKALEEKDTVSRFDRLLERMAEINDRYTEDEVAAEVEAARRERSR